MVDGALTAAYGVAMLGAGLAARPLSRAVFTVAPAHTAGGVLVAVAAVMALLCLGVRVVVGPDATVPPLLLLSAFIAAPAAVAAALMFGATLTLRGFRPDGVGVVAAKADNEYGAGMREGRLHSALAAGSRGSKTRSLLVLGEGPRVQTATQPPVSARKRAPKTSAQTPAHRARKSGNHNSRSRKNTTSSSASGSRRLARANTGEGSSASLREHKKMPTEEYMLKTLA